MLSAGTPPQQGALTRDGLVQGGQALQQRGHHLAQLQRVEVALQQHEDLGRGGVQGGGRVGWASSANIDSSSSRSSGSN